MSRSGYSDNGDHLNLYRANVDRSIKGKKGQAFLKGLAKALDEMPVKRLIAGDLVTKEGECCAIGAFCKAKGIKTEEVDVWDNEAVGNLVNISEMMAAEIEYENDEHYDWRWDKPETPEERWIRMRKWVQNSINKEENE